jgi:hypothetical protein
MPIRLRHIEPVNVRANFSQDKSYQLVDEVEFATCHEEEIFRGEF